LPVNLPPPYFDEHLGPDGVTIAAGANEPESNPATSARRVVAEDCRGAVLVTDDQVDITIVVKVSHG
jgi:hypothetical protein